MAIISLETGPFFFFFIAFPNIKIKKKGKGKENNVLYILYI
jgi:hypothetical protein